MEHRHSGVSETAAPGRILVGRAPAWNAVLREVDLVAASDATVLIRGETGTGKECIAREIHLRSPRRAGPFVAVNGAALSPHLLASELFGHEKGAFTGALDRRIGRVELAEGGTLFLDEVGDLPGEVQLLLLRFLQEHEYERVGGTVPRHADVRVVAATNRDLERLREENRFRDDLFYRLNVFPIRVPPLRERPEDISEFLAFFLERHARKSGKRFGHVDVQTTDLCRRYPWPGNVRELENLVERAVLLCPEPVFSMNPFAQAETGAAATSLEAVVRAHIIRALKLCRGKLYGADGAARLLGLKPTTLQSKLKRLGLDPKKYAFPDR